MQNNTKALLTLLLSIPNQASKITNLEEKINILLDERTNLQNELVQNNNHCATNLLARLIEATIKQDTANTAIDRLRDKHTAQDSTIAVLNHLQAPVHQAQQDISWPKEFDGTHFKVLVFIKQLYLRTASYATEQFY